MGLRGLMSFVEKQKHKYYKDYELHDCKLVIDAASLCQLTNLDGFKWENLGKSSADNRCYGGDYDKIEQILREFLSALKECNITPYFIYDGMKATDPKNKRIQDRLMNTCQLINPDLARAYLNNPTSQNSRGLTYPYGIKYTFRDVLLDLKLNIATTPNAESDNATAQLAKYLNCPVLANDSDFYIFGPNYIPLSSLQFPAREKNQYKYLKCSLMENDKLANELNTPYKCNMQYVLPILMGNDNNPKEQYSKFFEHMFHRSNWQRVNYDAQTEKVFWWIKSQTSLESAIKVIIKCFGSKQQKNAILSKIEDIIEEYSPAAIDGLLKYFKFEPAITSRQIIVNFKKLRVDLGLELEEKVLKNQHDILERPVPEPLMKKEIACKNPSFLMEIIRSDQYIMSLNIDDVKQPDSNRAAHDIIAAIYQILVQDSNKRLTIIERSQSTYDSVRLTEFVLPPCKIKHVPSVDEIATLEVESRKNFLLEVLGFDGRSDIQEMLKVFPGDSHVFLLATIYCKEKIGVPKAFIYALILCYLVINYADPKIGEFYRTTYDLQYRSKIKNIPSTPSKEDESEVLASMTATDLKIFLEKLISYFEISPTDNARTFDRPMMHILSQYNTVFFHVKHLNTLLDWPFKNGYISKVFNGTFLYNFSKKLESIMNPKQFLLELLESAATVRLSFIYICDRLNC